MKERTYFPLLDGLRFLAFFAVLIHHGPAMPIIPGYEWVRHNGWMGVDLFLCLSAFLFVHLLRKEWNETGTINVPFFYLRRGLRIWPLYFLFTAAMVAWWFRFNPPSGLQTMRAVGLWTFTDNLFFIPYSYNPIANVGHLWTIAYEEQFYAVIPWFLRYMFKQTQSTQLRVLGLISLAGLIIRALFIIFTQNYAAILVLPITHFEPILIGLAVGLGLFDPLLQRVPNWVTGVGGLVSLYLASLAGQWQIVEWRQMLQYPFVGLAVGLMVYTTLRAKSAIVSKTLGLKPMVFLGKISYGLYVFHVAALGFFTLWVTTTFRNKSDLKQALLILGLTFAATVICGIASYLMLEKPFLKLKSRFTIVQSRPA